MLGTAPNLTRVVSGGGSASADGHAEQPRHAHGRRPVQERASLHHPFNSCLQLVEEPPVGTLRDDLLWARLDHPGLVQAQRVEADRVLGVVVAPPVVRDVLHGLQRIVVVAA